MALGLFPIVGDTTVYVDVDITEPRQRSPVGISWYYYYEFPNEFSIWCLEKREAFRQTMTRQLI